MLEGRRDRRAGADGVRAGGGRRTVVVALLLIAPLVFGAPAAPPAPRPSAVLFIGDGMGQAIITATRVARGGSAGRLRLDAMPYTAIARTWSAGGPVTDSAAAVTAMACGRKTVNGVLGEDATAVYGKSEGTRIESIALWAKKRGMRVGLVTTTRVTHATPAGFYAATSDRDRERAIARQAVAAPLDLLLGGGRQFFRPGPPVSGDPGWSADDAEDLETAARARGWTLAATAADLRAITTLDRPVLGLFADSHLPYEAPGGQGASPGEAPARTAPTLEEMTIWAVRSLRRGGRPFFLMVEGGRIDHAEHANWARTAIDEMAAFDRSIGAAIDRLDPKTTLVLVTADHETGGLALNGYPPEKEGIFGTTAGEEGEPPYPVLSFASGPGAGEPARDAPYAGADPRPSGITLHSAAHTGVDVPLYAWGAGAAEAHGTVDNTAVYRLLRAHLEGRRLDRAALAAP
jgi:alkaline phosphatase